MAWVTEPLAAAGFLVVAFDHHGNNFLDGYLAEGFARWWERALDATFALDLLTEREEIGPAGAGGLLARRIHGRGADRRQIRP
jgi:predicted dienelactone hydrolase